MIKDSQSFDGARYDSGYAIATYDDGFGPLWISRNSLGINGIVRAQTFEEAYSICEDEFFPEADETIEELVKEYGFKRKQVKIVRDRETGEEHEARYPEEYPNGKLLDSLELVRWDVRETRDEEAWAENELFCEAYGFRPNGPNTRDSLKHGIYSKDLNGDYLDRLTPELVKEIGIVLEISEEE